MPGKLVSAATATTARNKIRETNCHPRETGCCKFPPPRGRFVTGEKIYNKNVVLVKYNGTKHVCN
jgi:hypothetical protein